MIKFKQYLEEARMAPLYHGTNIAAARGIINLDVLQGQTIQNDSRMFGGKKFDRHQSSMGSGVYGVSLSRSKRVSKKFGPIIFEFDQQKLLHNFKIRPYNYWYSDAAKVADTWYDRARMPEPDPGFGDNEYEEFLLGHIKNLKRYLTAIWVPASVYNGSTKEYWQKNPLVKPYET